MPTLTAAPIKVLKQLAADLDLEEAKLRREASALYAAAREAQAALTEGQKKRDDEIKDRLRAIAVDRIGNAEQLANEERLAELERTAQAAASAVTQVRESVADDPKRGFKNLGDFAMEILQCGPAPDAVRANPRLMAAAGTGMTQGVTAEGGVLVPPAFSTEIWDGARRQSESMLQYCDVHAIDPGVQSVTFPGVNETSRADGSRWGGVRGYWKGELTALTSSRPAFRDVKIEPQELYVFAYIADKLLRHAPGTASGFLARAAADEINFKLGDAIMNGDGAGKPRGCIGHASVVSISKETGQAAATIVRENIDKMWSRCDAMWRSGAVWFINQDTEPQLEQLSAIVGTGGVPVYLPAGGITEAPNARLKGRPVIPCEYSATLGTVGDISLCNLQAYCVGIRGGIDAATSMHLKFDYAQTAFRFIFEADGQPWLASAITPYKGTANSRSWCVTLATRA